MNSIYSARRRREMPNSIKRQSIPFALGATAFFAFCRRKTGRLSVTGSLFAKLTYHLLCHFVQFDYSVVFSLALAKIGFRNRRDKYVKRVNIC